MKTVFCDWGTTNIRAYLSENGEVVQTYFESTNLHDAKKIGFEIVLQKILDYFQVSRSTAIRMSGMVGSKNGWYEVPYVSTPASAKTVLGNALVVDTFPDLKILGGVSHEMSDGRQDVMRGEEIQVLGLLQKYPDAKAICLPGTHSKWVAIENAAIQCFSTWMTGEFFHCLSEHSILQAQMSSKDFCEAAFLKGVETAKTSGPILNSAFYLRTDYLFGKVTTEESYSYLSGFLIGQEIKVAAKDQSTVYLCGSDLLVDRYSRALGQMGISSTAVSAKEATVSGLRIFMNEEDGGN